ncbi:hypothetical protein CLIB1423_05S03004 [[Candida] railenensis]|uniref:Mannosyltransferase n=1 Tax=[Candida] railenensis TaxID=45579 RepID=A0A9P0QNH6_9ASCO|nr:hypothetical protein CLIB1423_05S03004 [[Candida] railenensis]
MNSTSATSIVQLLKENPQNAKLVLLGGIIIFVVVTFFQSINKSRKVKPAIGITEPTAKLNKNRKFGHWIPDYEFQTPIPPAFENWSIKETRPIPYRAFKHKYAINMGIRNMEWDSWFELDNEWEKFHIHKLERVEERGTELYQTLPPARDAVYELLDEMWQYLPNRYPTLFKQKEYGLDNLVTGEVHVFKEGFRTEKQEDPALTAAKMIQDDFAIMMENEEGVYHLKAGAILLAGFWRLKDKLNMPLSMIHTSGDVPKYNEKLKSGMEKFFIRQPCDKPVVRNNYFIQTDDHLPWSTSIGSESEEGIGWYTAEPATHAEQLYFRSERQSLRRLPKSGAIVFTVRTYFLPIAELAQEPYIPRRLLNGMSTWDTDVQEYKGWHKYKDVIVPYLEEKAREQEANGLVQEKEVYPF